MGQSRGILGSSVGRKAVMGVTGLLLVGFVITHLLGNLQIFVSQDKFNAYAQFLKEDIGNIIWIARGVLLVLFLAHVKIGIDLTRENLAARPVPYRSKEYIEASFASRYMLHTGLVILIFVVVHLLHFTFGVLQPENFFLIDSRGRHDVYSMVIHGFLDIRYSVLYIFCMLLLGLHLSHGIASLFRSLGFYHECYTKKINQFGCVLGWLLALGYISIPLSVILGIVHLPIE